jgi:hypothetical protein
VKVGVPKPLHRSIWPPEDILVCESLPPLVASNVLLFTKELMRTIALHAMLIVILWTAIVYHHRIVVPLSRSQLQMHLVEGTRFNQT